ncbi:MAG: hypothetical protein Q7S04_03125 [Candidatus Moranbacteria bacterium]|nr:hypothetical protein [Candidatus Moranbacteria bacterium]
METDIFGAAYIIWQNLAQFFSGSFLVAAIKFFLFIYVTVLFIDIILLLVLRGVSADIKKTLFGTHRPLLLRSTAINRFEKSLARLKSGNPSQYKVALLEVDAFADEVLSDIGYKGATMTEKLESIQDGHLGAKDLLIEAHHVRNRIIHEADFALTYEEAEKWITTYRVFFNEVELF